MGPRIELCKQTVNKNKSTIAAVQKKQLKRKPVSTKDVNDDLAKKKKTQQKDTVMASGPVLPKYSTVPVTFDPDMKAFNELYNLEMLIGSGGYGKVYSARRKSDHQTVAVKEMLLCNIKNWTSTDKGNRIPTEVVMLHKCQPANGVIRLIEYFQSKTNAMIIMERNTDFDDLSNFITDEKKLSDPKARHVIRQIVQTLAKCQSLGVMHMDLKQENVLIHKRNGDIKLLDFGLAKLVESSNQRFTQFRGTAAYRPPEHIKAKEAFVDSFTVWNIGCFAYSLFFGDVPFKTKNQILAGIVTKEAEIKTLSQGSRDFILQCLKPNQECRPLLQELLNHPWISSPPNSSDNSKINQPVSLM